MNINKKCKVVALQIPEGYQYQFKMNCTITACECIGYIPRTKEKTKIFSVAATSKNNSVMLLKILDVSSGNRKLYNLVEYFENIHLQYLEKYKYY